MANSTMKNVSNTSLERRATNYSKLSQNSSNATHIRISPSRRLEAVGQIQFGNKSQLPFPVIPNQKGIPLKQIKEFELSGEKYNSKEYKL